VRRAVREATDVLRGCGAQVTAWSSPDADRGLEIYLGILAADGGRACARRSATTSATHAFGMLLISTC